MNQPSDSSTQRGRLSEPATEHAEDRQLIESSGLFDPHWYVTRYPDVAGSGFDPIEHYLELGAGQGHSPGPAFDAAWYLVQNPAVASQRLNPLLHYLRQGASEGRTPRDPISPNVRQNAAKALASIMHLDPDLRDPSLIDFDTLPGRDGISRGRPYETLKALFRSLDSLYERLIFLACKPGINPLNSGVHAVAAAIDRYGPHSTLVVLTDDNCSDAKESLAATAQVRAFSEFSSNLSLADRSCLVRCLIQGFAPRSVMNLNSRACWEVYKHTGRALSVRTDLHAMLLCRDYAEPVEVSGQLDGFLQTCLPVLKKIYVETIECRNELISRCQIIPSLQHKLTVVGLE